MPRNSKATPLLSKQKVESLLDSSDPESSLPDQEPTTARGGRKKSRIQTSNEPPDVHDPGHGADVAIARDRSQSPARPASILGQLPPHFHGSRRSNVLDVLDEDLNSTQKVFDEHTPPTETWVQKGPYGKSPNTDQPPGLSIAGSPPFQPGPIGRGGFSRRTPPVSPPQRHARPLSYGGVVPPLPGQPRGSTSPYAHMNGAYGSPPALPHLPQAHFYGAPDIDLGIPPPGYNDKGPEPTFVKFTHLPGRVHEARNCVMLGSDGELHILSCHASKSEYTGHLGGLSGKVIDAAFLSWDRGLDPFAQQRPLVAVVLHGPVRGDQAPIPRPSSRMSNDEVSRRASFLGYDAHETAFVTRVEVYSLASQSLVAELLRTPPAAQQPSFRGAPLQAPSPMGGLKLHASGNFILVSSSTSGEIFAFSASTDTTSPRFECVGKYWTSLQPRLERRDSSHGRWADVDVSPADLGRASSESEQAILDVSGRWLAYCPASLPSRPSLGVIIGEHVSCSNASSFMSGTPPSRPPLNCEVDSPDADSLFSKVARGVALELVKGTKWVGEKGMQAWQSYWKKEGGMSPPVTSSYSSPTYQPQPVYSQFPPTHGDETWNTPREPDLVVIIDLRAVQEGREKRSPEANGILATFLPPRGCSFVSFTPNGLGLLTASKKGDVQYVWDMLQVRYPRMTVSPSDTDSARSTARVRQIARYERLSPSTVVEVAWESPLGTRFALLTLNRTIHIYDLPLNALRWPPPRTLRKSRPTSAPVEPSTLNKQHDQPPSGGFLASAMSIAGRTQPMFANLRGRAPSVGGGIAGIGASGIGLASATGVRSGKAMAAGLSKSLGAASETVSTIRHAGQSRLHLKSNAVTGRLRWQTRGNRSVLCVLDAHGLKEYFVRKTKPREGRLWESVTVFDAQRALSVKFPSMIESVRQMSSRQEPEVPLKSETEQQYHGFWNPKLARPTQSRGISPPLSHAEIDTNAPYQPFHSDHRVTLSVYSDAHSLAESQLPTVSAILQADVHGEPDQKQEQWVFGGDIPTVQLNLGSPRHGDDDDDEKYRGSVIYRETSVNHSTENDDMDQIVSTTRRRRARKDDTGPITESGELDEEGFFEDDCDVLDFADRRV